MYIIQKMSKILSDGDTTGAEQIIHDDYKFLMHASGKSLSKKDVVSWIGMKDVKKDKVRVLFENDEVGFEHAMVSFNDGNKEAVMTYYKFKDGKIIHQETGATKLFKNLMFPKKYSNLLFILIMGFGMSLMMTLIITYINTGMDSEYINRFLKAWVVSLPIAIVAALFVGPITKKFVDKITR